MIWNFKEFEDRTALIAEDRTTVTYKELSEAGDRLADVIGRRCLVFSFCTNTPGSILGYTAFLNHEIVPVLLNNGLEQGLAEELITTYEPAYLWLPEGDKDRFANLTEVYADQGYCLMKTAYDTDYELHPELTLLLTTSGSTGSPKFVRQSKKNIIANTKSIVQYLELDKDQRAITTLPMNYTYGLSIINTHLWVGATLLLTDKTLMQKEFWTFIKEQKATSFGGVPYTYEMLDKLRFLRMDLPSIQYMTQAGGKLGEELHRKFAEHSLENGRKFIVMYGQCEATARMGYLPAESSLSKVGSMGVPIPGGEFELIDVNGNVIDQPHVTGELVYRGENVTLGYAETKEDLAKGDERDGRLETGDMAQFDEDGYYYIVGRKKRFLKIFGNRVNLDEIDRLIKAEFNFIDCASAGVDDHLYVFVTDPELESSVRSFVIDKTGFNPTAIKVLTIDEIPKNDSGKVLYKELTKYYD